MIGKNNFKLSFSYNWIINIIFSTLSIETKNKKKELLKRRSSKNLARRKELSSFSVGLNIIHASWKLKHNLLSFRPSINAMSYTVRYFWKWMRTFNFSFLLFLALHNATWSLTWIWDQRKCGYVYILSDCFRKVDITEEL